MRSRGRRFTVLLALVVATASASVAYLAVAGSDKEPAAGAVGPVPTALPTDPVVIARWDIPTGTTLTADMLDVLQLPPGARSPRALTDLDQAVGRLTAAPLTAGEQLVDIRLTEQPDSPEKPSREIPPGLRAMAFVFDEVQGTAGLVQPGDHVDVLAYFEFEVDNLTISADDDEDADEPDGEDATDEGDEGDEGDEADAEDEDTGDDDEVTVRVDVETDQEEEEDDYHQYVSVYVVQNVEVWAVAQAMTPEESGINDREPELPATEGEAATAEEAPDDAQARPDARSITLLVTPEQAPRLLLAAQTVTDKRQERDAALRLITRAPGDTTIYDLPPAQLGTIPIGGLIGDVNIPLTPSELVITDVIFTKRVVNSGEVLEFSATVKNVSDRTLRSGPDAPPEYVYTQGIAYDDLGFFGQPDTFRIGLNVSGAYPTPFPYRWSLGRDLAPGESTTIVGAVQLTEPTPGARYWLGVIQERNTVTQDGVAVTDVTVLASEVVTVAQPSAVVLDAPEPAAALVDTVAEGERLTVLGVHGPWFRVRAGDAEGWIAAGSIAAEPAAGEPANGSTGSTEPDLIGRLRDELSQWQ